MRIRILTVACLAALLGGGAALADPAVYKWVDAQGKVHYSTEPHTDSAKQLNVPSAPSNPSPAQPAAPSAAPGAATVSAASDASLVQPQAADSPVCKEARDRLFKFLHSDRLYQLDSQGNRIPLSDADQQKAISDARTNASRACNGGGT